MEGVGIGLIAIIVVIALLEFALVIWALIDAIRRPRTSLLPKWAWVVLILVFEFVGPILYLLLGRRDEAIVDDWRAQTAGQRYVAPPPYVAPTDPGAAGDAAGGGPRPGAPDAAPAGSPAPDAVPGGDEAGVEDSAAGDAVIPAAPEAPDAPEPGRSRAERAVDTLYGTNTPAD